MLQEHGDWLPLGNADEQKEALEGTVEAWGRSPDNPVAGLVRWMFIGQPGQKTCAAVGRSEPAEQLGYQVLLLPKPGTGDHLDFDAPLAGNHRMQPGRERAGEGLVEEPVDVGDLLAMRDEGGPVLTERARVLARLEANNGHAGPGR